MVSIFLSVFNVHANRMPVGGKFIDVQYVKGKFLAAFDHKASDCNERMEIKIKTKFGIITVKQIAGLIARRILCYANEGSELKQGDRYGFIRFGSRVDHYVPINSKVKVKLGQKVKNSVDVLAEI